MKFDFNPPAYSPALEALRGEVRDFVRENLADMPNHKKAESWSGRSEEFSRQLGRRGWIGMVWPKRYGGHERSPLERYVVLEELLAAGAPVNAHWTADRQSGPLILRYGTEEQRQELLPRIAAGECYFCIGMSEPNAGSDLAGILTRGKKVEGGWEINGTKIWTSSAHRSNYMILLCRTSPQSEDRHAGLSQFIVDLKRPGIAIRPIRNLAGQEHFNEVVFTDCFLPDSAILGQVGAGWKQVNSELAFERSGPERFLSTFVLLREMVRALGPAPSERAAIAVGRLIAHLATLRRMSFAVAGAMQAGRDPLLEGSVVKDLGAVFEQSMPEIARDIVEAAPAFRSGGDGYQAVLGIVMLDAPSFSLRGGTREILRGIIARGLGLR